MKRNSNEKNSYFDSSVAVQFNGREYEVECYAIGMMYCSIYENGFIDVEIDDVEVKEIKNIYDTEKKDFEPDLKDNSDFIKTLEEELQNDDNGEWINKDVERKEREEENRLYGLCEMAEKDYMA